MRELRLSQQDQDNLRGFLCELVRTPSLSGHEGALAALIVAEMQRLGLRDVHTDRIGNVIGWVGPGQGSLLMLNGHMDTVEVTDPSAWQHPPYGAEIERGQLYGLGACDMKGGLAAMMYGAKLLRDSGLDLKGDLVVACVVLEEPCEGLGSRVLIEEEGVRPDWVVLGEPTDLDISRGHRGRVEMRVVTGGRSAHSANPELGDNAIYSASRLVFGLEMISAQAAQDSFLGPGTLAVTHIESRGASSNAIPDRCELVVDRRLTLGETELKSLAEVQRVIAREKVRAEVTVHENEGSSYTGYHYRERSCHAPWVMADGHPLVTTALHAVRSQLRRRVQLTRYDFSTEGVYTAGSAGIPTIGFGPGDPRLAHTVDEHIRLDDVYAATEGFARLAWELLSQD